MNEGLIIASIVLGVFVFFGVLFGLLFAGINEATWTRINDQCFVHVVHNNRITGTDVTTRKVFCERNF